jgi:hypothetical protein
MTESPQALDEALAGYLEVVELIGSQVVGRFSIVRIEQTDRFIPKEDRHDQKALVAQ